MFLFEMFSLDISKVNLSLIYLNIVMVNDFLYVLARSCSMYIVLLLIHISKEVG